MEIVMLVGVAAICATISVCTIWIGHDVAMEVMKLRHELENLRWDMNRRPKE